MSEHPITLKTKYGLEQYDILARQKRDYLRIGALEAFQEQCQEDFTTVSMYIKYFLEDPTMMQQHKLDEFDMTSWGMYKELSDMASCLRYFSGSEFWKTH